MPKQYPPLTEKELLDIERVSDDSFFVERLAAEIRRLRELCGRAAEKIHPYSEQFNDGFLPVIEDELRAASEGLV